MTEKTKKTTALPFRFEEMEHTADVALRVRGKNLGELMGNAAEGMASLLCDPNALSERTAQRIVEVEAEDAEGLLVEWLSELAYLAETESEVFDSCEFERISPTSLKATARFKKASELKVHVKAVTYHNLEIVETESGPEAVVVFDI